jgi:hypothetical protein
MMNENSINMEAKEDYNEKLDVILKMIENAKSNIRDNAFFYLLWGWLVLAASLTHFILMQFGIPYSFIAWPVLMTIGTVASIVAGIRLGKRSNYITHLDMAIMYLWWGFFFTILILLAFSITGLIPWNISNALIISMYGMGTFVSGGILKFKPLIFGGISCWIISLLVFVIPFEYSLLLVAVSIIIAYLVPGYMLRSTKK